MGGTLQLDILGTIYKIEKTNINFKEDYMGLCKLREKRIEVDENLSEVDFKKTLAHEVTHAYLCETAFRNTTLPEDPEEFICDVVANVNYLMSTIKEK